MTKVHLVALGKIQPLSRDQQRMIDHVATVYVDGMPRLSDVCKALGWEVHRARRTLAELEELGLASVLQVEVNTRRLVRLCTRCLAQLGREMCPRATHVATGASGISWFECGEHDPIDNEAEETRLLLEPIEDWFSRYGLSL
jgi:hypothetical protein